MKQRLTIVKMGGKVIDDTSLFELALNGFSQIEGPRILVHGGGNVASALMKRMNIEPVMREGRRITDDAAREVVVMTYAGTINKKVTATLQAKGVSAIGLSGADLNLISAIKRPVDKIDYGWAGDITGINTNAFENLLDWGAVPVICPITHDGKGELLNTNADTIASEIAKALSVKYAVDLIYTFELPGVMEDLESGRLFSSLTRSRFRGSVKNGVISGGMIPKIENALSSVEGGVERVVICGHEALGHWGTRHFIGTIIEHE